MTHHFDLSRVRWVLFGYSLIQIDINLARCNYNSGLACLQKLTEMAIFFMFMLLVVMNNMTSNINFTSNIRFISCARYEKLTNKPDLIKVQEMWQLGQVKEVQKKGATGTIIYCVAGIIKDLNKKSDYIFHWFPTNMFKADPTTAKNQLKIKKAMEYMAKNKEVKGFLIGGICKKDAYVNALSMKLINFIKTPFKKTERKDFTMFFAQDTKYAFAWDRPQSAFLYNKETDTYYVNCKSAQDGRWHDLLNKDEIRKHFDYISISPNDKVFIGHEQIPNEFFNKPKH